MMINPVTALREVLRAFASRRSCDCWIQSEGFTVFFGLCLDRIREQAHRVNNIADLRFQQPLKIIKFDF